jgi:multidrug efflux pump subunit AcrB
VLLVYWYESVRVALCLVVTSLLALPGVALALWLTGTQLNIASMMGLAMIAGSVVEAGVFLCSEVLEPVEAAGGEATTGDLRARARARVTAAALRRIRPIAMTTIAAILAMVPLIIGLGQGAAMLRPLAVAIVAGLIVQLPLVLVVLPALLTISGRFAGGSRRKRCRPPIAYGVTTTILNVPGFIVGRAGRPPFPASLAGSNSAVGR